MLHAARQSLGRAAPNASTARAWFDRTRVRHWAHFLLLPLVTFDPSRADAAALFAAARGVASAFAILAFGYLLNSVSDRRMDLDARKNPFILPGPTEHRYSLAALVAVSLGLAAFSPWPAQLATAACLLFGYVYSMGPRIKSIPILGTVANLGNFGPLLFVGMQSTTLPPRFEYVALAFAALLLQNQLIHEAADTVEDRGGGIRTTWLTLGPNWTAALAAVSGLGAAIAAAAIAPSARSTVVLVIVAAVYGGVFPTLLARRELESPSAARLRIAHRWCALLSGAGLFLAWRWAA